MTTTEAPAAPTGAPGANPFVGPRSLTRDERLFGRDRELRELRNLIVADRIVLCYSPSGAGKTSLIQAGLVPRLEEDGFAVLPVVRVGRRPDDGEGNRYVAAALASLGAEPGATLASYLAGLALPDGRTGVLVFDQFEEVLSLDPTDGDAKRELLAQIGEVLRDRRWFALFAMREDFLAALDPYLPLLPTRLSTRFRLDLLTPAAASQVVAGTAAAAHRTCAPDACEDLVTELRRLVDGRLGPYVEPVQLQVVCRQLWDRLPPTATVITRADVGAVGGVDEALGAFYDERVGAVAAETGAAERGVRDWFERQLITDRGYRNQVQTGPTSDPRVLRLLEDAHLLRAETRRGTTWYELAHDRLVQPVRGANRVWREEHLSAFQRQAELWDEHGRRDDMVVVDEVLGEGERLAAAGADALTAAEAAFLTACRRARDENERERLAARRTRQLAVFSTVGLAVAVLASAVAFAQLSAARTQRNRAEANERLRLATPAADAVDSDPNASVILALQAVAGDTRVTDRAGLDAQRALYQRVYRTARVGVTIPRRGVRRAVYDPRGPSIAVAGAAGSAVVDPAHLDDAGEISDVPALDAAFAPDGTAVAVAGRNGLVSVWVVGGSEDEEGGSFELQAADKRSPVNAVAFDPAGDRLAVAAGAVAQVWRWRDGDGEDAVTTLAGHSAAVRGVAFDPKGATLATASSDGTIKVWSVPGDGPASETATLTGHVGAVNGVAFSPDGTRLLSGGEDGTARLWDVATGKVVREMSGHHAGIDDVAFRGDGLRVATAGDDGTAKVWDPATGRVVAEAGGGNGPVTGVSFSRDGHRLLLATSDGAPAEWDVTTEAPPGHAGAVADVAVSPEGDRIATAGDDGTAAVWDLAGHELVALTGHEDSVRAVAFGPGGRVATAGWDGTARVWDAATGVPVWVFSGRSESVADVALSPDGTRLATAGEDGTARVWDTIRGLQVWSQDDEAGFGGVAFTADGRRLVTGLGDGSATVWDAATGAVVRKLPAAADDGTGGGVAVSPDGALVAEATDAGTVVWDAASGAVRATLGHAVEDPRTVAFSPDGSLLLGADAAVRRVADGSVVAQLEGDAGGAFTPGGRTVATAGRGPTARLWETTTGRLVGTIGTPPAGHAGGVVALAAGGAGGRLATGGDDGVALVWDGTSGRPLQRLVHGAGVTAVRFSPDGSRLATAGQDGTAKVWDVASGRLLATVPPGGGDEGVESSVDLVAFSGASRLVTVVEEGDGERAVAVTWDLPGGAVVARHTLASPSPAAISADGRWVAGEGDDGLVVLDTRSGRRRASFPDISGVYTAAFDGSGSRLLVDGDGDEEERLFLVDVDRRTTADLPLGSASVETVALSPDGRLALATAWGQVLVWDTAARTQAFDVPLGDDLAVATFGAGGRTLLATTETGAGHPVAYPLRLADLVREARAHVARRLTDDECQRYLQRRAPCAASPRG